MLGRRKILKGFAAAPLVGAPLAAVLANPDLARAAADRLTRQTARLESGKSVHAYLAMPAKTPAPAIVTIHEWWGVNDQIKAVTAEFANQGYLALAIDLMGGAVATTRKAASAQMKAVDGAQADETAAHWVNWLRGHDKSTGKIGTVGWCFGGGWSLNASIAAPVDATVIYYGRVTRPEQDLARLRGPVLGHFATQDKWINKKMVGAFEAAMKGAGKSIASHWYEANHAFANPTSARYDAGDATLAWTRTLDFFRANLG